MQSVDDEMHAAVSSVAVGFVVAAADDVCHFLVEPVTMDSYHLATDGTVHKPVISANFILLLSDVDQITSEHVPWPVHFVTSTLFSLNHAIV
jgi:hypothetical protein